jgi:murein DD-endopeptidase MepM/ murein hydrolase activator NlpD
LSKAASDKQAGRTHRRVASLIAALVLGTALIGAQSASAQSGGVGAPGDTTTTTPTDPATTTTPTAPAPAGTMIFPVAGAHTIGQGIGAPRAGHSHQGQDIMAACGTPLVAISRAKVKFVATQRSAGNYVVIRNKKAHQDYMYAHLAAPASVAKGTVVQPGQPIGIVGDTGNAQACHLHFELWQGKWYRGGSPVDPLPFLQTLQGF